LEPYLAKGNNPVAAVYPNGELAGTIVGVLIGGGVATWNSENICGGTVSGATFDLIAGLR
jgi:hypothetical protein